MPPLWLNRERVYKLKCCCEHFFDVYPASVVHFLLPSVSKILFVGPGGSRKLTPSMYLVP